MPIQNVIIEAALPQLHPEKNSITHNNRVWTHWRAIPGFLTLTASIVAVIAALVWNSPYLCIAFGVGGLASCYSIYLGSSFHHLQTFEANNQQLRQKITHFETQNQRLKKTNLSLKNISHDFQNENRELLKHTDRLGNKNNELDKIVQDMNNKLHSQVAKLKGVRNALNKVELSTQENHHTFTQNLEEFNAEVGNLKRVKDQFDTIGSEVNQKMHELATTQIENALSIQNILQNYRELTDKDVVLKKVELLQNLNRKLNTLENQISRNEGISNELSNHVNDLEVIREDLDNGVSKLAKEVTYAAKVFNVYQAYGMGRGK